jgi:hypothetical protein
MDTSSLNGAQYLMYEFLNKSIIFFLSNQVLKIKINDHQLKITEFKSLKSFHTKQTIPYTILSR